MRSPRYVAGSDTSKAAAESIDPRPLAEQLMVAYADAREHGLTQSELLAAFHWVAYPSLTGRIADLRAAGEILDSGDRRRSPETGRQQRVMVAAAYGPPSPQLSLFSDAEDQS